MNNMELKHKTVVLYKFKNVTYDGSVELIPHWNENNRWNKLVIRLSHDGFRYPKVDLTNVAAIKTYHHNKFNWLILNEDF